MAASNVPGSPPRSPSTSSASSPAEDVPTLRLFSDVWTSRHIDHPMISLVTVLEDGGTVINFTLPHDYVELTGARTRWEGWVEIVNHPTGLGILPPGTTDRQRAAIRGLARALMFFACHNAGPAPQRDWVHFIQHVRDVASAQHLTGEHQLEVIVDWVRSEWIASREWNVAHGHPASARDGLGAAAAAQVEDVAAEQPVTEVDTRAEEPVTDDDSASDSSIPSLVTVVESD